MPELLRPGAASAFPQLYVTAHFIGSRVDQDFLALKAVLMAWLVRGHPAYSSWASMSCADGEGTQSTMHK